MIIELEVWTIEDVIVFILTKFVFKAHYVSWLVISLGTNDSTLVYSELRGSLKVSRSTKLIIMIQP